VSHFEPLKNEQMKAIVYTEYGPPEVLQLKEVAKPLPKVDEVLIRIHATAVNSGDCRLRKPDPFAVRLFWGFFKPKTTILGVVFAGKIENIGQNVTQFKIGDNVFGMTGMRMGAYAEYKCLPEKGCIALMPNNINYNEAAAIPFGGNTALDFMRKADIQKGQKVLIYGASGAVGTAALQLAKHFGAEVTGVCSTKNVAFVQSLGADKVIDYTKEDFTLNGEIYDLLFETVGKISFAKSVQSLSKKGTLILGSAGVSTILMGLWTKMTSGMKIILGGVAEKAENLIFLRELIEKGTFKPVVTAIYPMEEIVEAHRQVETGHKVGNLVIQINNYK
jgi:NADPH:quinone reductase-like Zn-dependent oxidoreductase